MEHSYKFRLYPSKDQEKQIVNTFGCCRFVFNHYLEKRNDVYANEKRTFCYYDCAKDLTELKESAPWLKCVDSSALQNSLSDLERAFQEFFRRVKNGQKFGYPKFKSKHEHKQSYRSQFSKNNIRVTDHSVRLPKLGEVKCRVSKKVEGRILSATVSCNSSGKYFVSLCCTDVEHDHLPATGKNIGIDVGIKSLVVGSDGAKYVNHKYYLKNQKKISRLHKQLSRKTKGSNRYEKLRIKIANIYEHVANQRNDALHKLSSFLVREYDVVCLEDLRSKNMAKNRNLSKMIYDAGWNELSRQIKYKAFWYGRTTSVVNQFFPSSQLCSNCHTQWHGAKNLRVRQWICPECGAVLDRDVNAAKNILDEGLRLLK